MTSDYKKITQSLNYFAQQCGDKQHLNRMKAVKLLFLADRYHLRKYGRLITDDTYYAMGHGPVGSSALNFVKEPDLLIDKESSYVKKFIMPQGNYDFKSIDKVDLDVLSETDIEALNFVRDNFGKLTQWELKDLTHILPEWKKFEETLKNTKQAHMEIDDFFEDPSPDTKDYDKFFSNGDIFKKETNEELREVVKEELGLRNNWTS